MQQMYCYADTYNGTSNKGNTLSEQVVDTDTTPAIVISMTPGESDGELSVDINADAGRPIDPSLIEAALLKVIEWFNTNLVAVE